MVGLIIIHKLMMAHLVLICLVVLLVGFGNAQLQTILQMLKFKMSDETMVSILQQCFKAGSNYVDTLVFVGSASDILRVNHTFMESIAVIQIENPATSWVDPVNGSAIFRHVLPIFIVILYDGYTLKNLLLGMEKTRWYNHLGMFFLLDRTTPNLNCSCPETALKLLSTAWEMDILNGMFLCDVRSDTKTDLVHVYTFNPFKETAPSPWRRVGTHVGPRGEPWTLFEQRYHPDRTTCRSLNFEEKTLDLNGYGITANVKPYPPRLLIKTHSKGIFDFGGTEAHLVRTIWRKLNASVNLKIYKINANYGRSLENGSSNGLLGQVAQSKCDMNLNLGYIMRKMNVRFTVTTATGGVAIITKHRGFQTTLHKIVSFIQPSIIAILFAICFITILVTGYSVYYSTFPDLLNVIRLLLVSPMTRLPRTSSQRLLLFSTMLLVHAINSTIQAKIASLLTTTIPDPQINTIDDIVKADYDIYTSRWIKEFIPDGPKNIVPMSPFRSSDCRTILETNSKAACILTRTKIQQLELNRSLHSSDEIITFHEAYVTRVNWPLYDRFNILIGRIFESGVTTYWKIDEAVNKVTTKRANLPGSTVRPIKFTDLRFAVIILAANLAVSSVVFIIEILMATRHRVIHIPPFPYID